MGAETLDAILIQMGCFIRVKWGNEPVREVGSTGSDWHRYAGRTLRTHGLGWASLYVNGQLVRYARSPGYGPYWPDPQAEGE